MLYWVQKEIERIRSIMQKRTLEVWANGELLQVAVGDILYIVIPGTPGEHIKPKVHMLNGEVFSCTRLLNAVEEKLGDGFIRLSRRCVAAIRAIHTISDYVYLNNGEKLAYSPRKKQMLIDSLQSRRKYYIISHGKDNRCQQRNTVNIIEALIICRLLLRILRWCLTTLSMRWTGYSAMEMRHWQSWRRRRLMR